MIFLFLLTINLVMADDVAGDNEECLLCEILNENPLKLAPSKDDIDQLLLHHVLVKVRVNDNHKI